MKITMEAPEAMDSGRNVEKVYTNPKNIGRDTTTYGTKAFAVDISGTVMDNTAYGGHGRTTEDVMQEAGEQDIASRRNYMAIMSNTMSGEDFAKLQEEGFHPGSTEVETVVTIVDHIKAAIVQGGDEVIGYTDDLDAEKLRAITGNAVLAKELTKQFSAHDIPATGENVREAKKAWEKSQELTELSEGAMKFMLENKLAPTIENLYLARFSGAVDAGKQGSGYYAQDMGGYYAQKADRYNWDALTAQMEKVIEEAGYEVNDQTVKDSKWLIEKGVPLNEEAFTGLQQLKELKLPQSMEEVAETIAAAIADGKGPLEADMQDHRSYLEKAIIYSEEIEEIQPQAVDILLARKQMITIKNLLTAQKEVKQEVLDGPQDNTSEAVTAKRQLEEIRLKMTVTANLRLLRSGIAIETAPLEQLVDRLKEAEATIQMQMTGAKISTQAVLSYSLYQETLTKVSEVAAMPASVIGRMAIADPQDISTLNQIHQSGKVLQDTYEKAGESYEAVMTAPRRDMGDSIRKAFRNVDAILEDMDLETTESNQRAVRILGYNSMEMTGENIEAVKQKDTLLQDVIGRMKPGMVLEMIREGVNPLTMSLEELRSYLSGSGETPAEAMEDYSRFLYKLEKKGEITSQERSAYIGVYRLLRQIEKTDSAVVGSMIKAETEFSLGNILTAIRSGKKQGMNVQVNDQFGGVSAAPSKEDLKEIMGSLESKEADDMYAEEQVREVQELKNTEDAVIRMLLGHKQPVTWNHLMAAGSMMKYPGRLFRRTGELAGETGKEEDLKQEVENLHEKFTDKESAGEAYQQLREVVTDILEDAAYDERVGYLDVKELSMMCKQVSLTASLAGEERYEVPVDINGELTSINLRIIHDAADSGKVAASVYTEQLGKVACEFRITGGILSGYIACNDREGLDKLKDSRTELANILSGSTLEAGIEMGDISYVESKKLDLNNFADVSEEEAGTENMVSTEELYLIAKAFIGYFQKAAQIQNQ